MTSRWRREAAPLIAAVLAEARVQGWDEKRTRSELKAAYPFGVRKYHPYKIWLSEIARQQGQQTPAERRKPPAPPADPRQIQLFGDET